MFETVAIVGVGLLGGSLARDLRAQGLAKKIIGVARSQQTADIAIETGIVDVIEPLSAAASKADLVVLATPMQAMLPLLNSIAEVLPASAIITDVGSVKTDLHAQLTELHPQLLPQFVMAHPIAGGENSGVTAAKQGLFVGKHVILTPTAESDQNANSKVAELWAAVGAKVVRMSLQEHDAIFAKTSHLPHVVAFSLVNYLSAQHNRDQLFDLAAAGFYDFTRIASSNAEMWRDICITNRSQVIGALDGFLQQLGEIREKINNSDQQGILECFDAAKQARDAGLTNKRPTN